MKRNVFSIFAIVLTIFIVLMLTSCLAEEPDSKGLEYRVNSDEKTCTITGLGEYLEPEVIIPEKIGKYTVTTIADSAFIGAQFTKVHLPDTIISIGREAFYMCELLVDINLPSSLKQIGKSAFQYCSSLESIKIPKLINILPENVFYGCGSLKKVEFSEGLITIGKTAFCQCESLEQIVFPSSLQVIKEGAFMWCKQLTEVELPKRILVLEYYIFSFCENLTDIHIPTSVASVSVSIAIGCPKLNSITVDDSNPYFMSLDGVLYNKEVSYLLAYPSGKKDSTFIIPDTVTGIFHSSFSTNPYIEVINIPRTLNRLEGAVFSWCDNLKVVNYEGTIEEWEYIVKASDWDADSSNFIIYCTDGQITKDGAVTYK